MPYLRSTYQHAIALRLEAASQTGQNDHLRHALDYVLESRSGNMRAADRWADREFIVFYLLPKKGYVFYRKQQAAVADVELIELSADGWRSFLDGRAAWTAAPRQLRDWLSLPKVVVSWSDPSILEERRETVGPLWASKKLTNVQYPGFDVPQPKLLSAHDLR